MRFQQEFRVRQDVAKVWDYFNDPEEVAQCLPGFKSVEVVDADNMSVVITQRLGPMAVTFDAKVEITERTAPQKIAFISTGKAIRGAVGNFRASNAVELVPEDGGTRVLVEGEVALAGALGSVAQKVITKQAEKATTQFAQNLEQALSGKGATDDEALAGDPASSDEAGAATTDAAMATAAVAPGASRAAVGSASGPSAGASHHSGRRAASAVSTPLAPTTVYAPDRWGRISAGLSAASLVLSLIILWQVS